MPVLSETRIQGGDVLLAYGEAEGIERLCVETGAMFFLAFLTMNATG